MKSTPLAGPPPTSASVPAGNPAAGTISSRSRRASACDDSAPYSSRLAAISRA